ncbi:hypothetical protein M9458_000282, partial [Cirrhinus mrigala]
GLPAVGMAAPPALDGRGKRRRHSDVDGAAMEDGQMQDEEAQGEEKDMEEVFARGGTQNSTGHLPQAVDVSPRVSR